MIGEPKMPGPENIPSNENNENNEMSDSIDDNEDVSVESPVDENLDNKQIAEDKAAIAAAREVLASLKTEEVDKSRATEIIDLQVQFLSADRPKSGRVMWDTINQIHEQYRNLDMDPQQAKRFRELIDEMRNLVEKDAEEDNAPGKKTDYKKLTAAAQAMNDFVKSL